MSISGFVSLGFTRRNHHATTATPAILTHLVTPRATPFPPSPVSRHPSSIPEAGSGRGKPVGWTPSAVGSLPNNCVLLLPAVPEVECHAPTVPGIDLDGYGPAGLDLRDVEPRNERLAVRFIHVALCRVDLQHELHDRILVDGRSGVDQAHDRR